MRHLPMRQLLTCLICLFLATTAVAAEATSEFKLSGWTEAVQSVGQLEPHRDFLEQAAGWSVLAEGEVERPLLRAWNLPDSVQARYILMGNAGTERGYIRLVQFEGAEQRLARSNAQPWEAGGIFDLNVRVKNMDRNFEDFMARGWQAFSDPIQYRFGPFEVKEWITVGPDGLAFALIERIEPPLEGWPQLRNISRSFNSTQIVRDMPAALHFYRDVLGLQKYLQWTGVSKEPGENVLGLPFELTTKVEREVWILHPEGLNEGSVELLAFNGVSGRHFGEHAAPPNLGLLMLRFPVRGIEALEARLRENGFAPLSATATVNIAPWGPSRMISVQSPEGAWLDFYEPLAASSDDQTHTGEPTHE